MNNYKKEFFKVLSYYLDTNTLYHLSLCNRQCYQIVLNHPVIYQYTIFHPFNCGRRYQILMDVFEYDNIDYFINIHDTELVYKYCRYVLKFPKITWENKHFKTLLTIVKKEPKLRRFDMFKIGRWFQYGYGRNINLSNCTDILDVLETIKKEWDKYYLKIHSLTDTTIGKNWKLFKESFCLGCQYTQSEHRHNSNWKPIKFKTTKMDSLISKVLKGIGNNKY